MSQKSIGIIGGSGLYELAKNAKELEMDTPYGRVQLYESNISGVDVFFLPRHGKSHHLPPHKINYKANIFALHIKKARCILSTAAVGSLKESFCPGKFGFVGQFIDYTKEREDTFFDTFEKGIQHTDMSDPYDQNINLLLKKIMSELKIPGEGPLTMIVTQGPRFESSAEIKAFQMWGADIVGMTGYPEVALANELGIPFATLAVSTNYAAGISDNPLTHQEVIDQMAKNAEQLLQIIKSFISSF